MLLSSNEADHVSPLVVVDEIAVGHVSEAFAVAVLATFGGHHLVGDEVWQEGCACSCRETHVRSLHGGRQQCKNLIAGALQ